MVLMLESLLKFFMKYEVYVNKVKLLKQLHGPSCVNHLTLWEALLLRKNIFQAMYALIFSVNPYEGEGSTSDPREILFVLSVTK